MTTRHRRFYRPSPSITPRPAHAPVISKHIWRPYPLVDHGIMGTIFAHFVTVLARDAPARCQFDVHFTSSGTALPPRRLLGDKGRWPLAVQARRCSASSTTWPAPLPAPHTHCRHTRALYHSPRTRSRSAIAANSPIASRRGSRHYTQ